MGTFRARIDLSVGGMVSLGTVIVATRFTDDPATVAMWTVIVLLLGLGIGALNGWILVQAELPWAMARDGTFPRWFAATNRAGVPARALVVSDRPQLPLFGAVAEASARN